MSAFDRNPRPSVTHAPSSSRAPQPRATALASSTPEAGLRRAPSETGREAGATPPAAPIIQRDFARIPITRSSLQATTATETERQTGRADLEAVQFSSTPGSRSVEPDTTSQHATAAEGVTGASGPLPYLDQIQRQFGRHDVTGVKVHVGGAAAQAARAIGAIAYARGSAIAFTAPPDLHTAAHEAAHVVQQRAGVVLDGGIGAAGDHYEQHADAVADRIVAGRSAEGLLDATIAASAGAATSRAAIQRKDAPTQSTAREEALRQSLPEDERHLPAASAEPEKHTYGIDPWEHMFGEASIPVNKLGRVQAPRGLWLRQKPSPDSAPNVSAPLPFNARVMVVRRTTQPTANKRWCYVIAPDHGGAGFCEERYLAIDPPEPNARLHRIEHGETLGKIARDAYGAHITDANNERLYVQALYEANKDRAGVTLTPVQLPRSETLLRREAEEQTVEIYKGVQVLEGMSLWIPSNEFIQRLKVSGAITSGSTELSKAWRAAAEFADTAIEAVEYAAGFLVGALEGAWSAIVDLFKGAAEMVEVIAETLYHLVTGNPGRIKDMLMKWVDQMKSAWEHRGQIADEFLKKWNAPSGWDRGRFQGEVLGWVMMTVLIIIATAGSGAAANAGSLAARFPQIVKLLKIVDAVGDVTTYFGAAVKGIRAGGKIPGAATDIVRGKLGKPLGSGPKPGPGPTPGPGPGPTSGPDRTPEIPRPEPPRSWSKFDPAHNDNFRDRLQQFRGNDDHKPNFSGGEGRIFTSDGQPVALKRWFASRLDDMPESISKLERVAGDVAANPRLAHDIDVVQIHERGPDWILRDFDASSIELKHAGEAAQAARARAIAQLEQLRANGQLTEMLADLLRKLRKEPPSANLHWSPERNRILVIDMQ